MFHDSDAAGSEDGGGPIETGTVVAEDGTVLTVTWRGVDPSLAPGTAEYRKAKRLADNRASAARSRALQRLKLNDSGVSALLAAGSTLTARQCRLPSACPCMAPLASTGGVLGINMFACASCLLSFLTIPAEPCGDPEFRDYCPS